MILIVSDKFDIHADIIVEKLQKRGANVIRFDIDFESLLETFIKFHNSGFELRTPKGHVLSTQIRKVMLRRTFVELSYEMMDELTTAHKIWRGEWNKSLQGVYHFLKGIPTINPPKFAFAAENKFLQMDTARQIGFNVPDSIISNCKDDLLHFQRDHGDIVLKMMYQDLYREKSGEINGLYVNKISGELLDFQEKGENPVFFQQYIEKSFEVRYTAIEQIHLACRIDSQSSPRSKVDWRRYDLPNTPYSAITPPKDVRDKVCALLEKLGLTFGALDFVVSPSGEWYFLEINPMGQWLWVEIVGLPISDEIVNWLMRGVL